MRFVTKTTLQPEGCKSKCAKNTVPYLFRGVDNNPTTIVDPYGLSGEKRLASYALPRKYRLGRHEKGPEVEFYQIVGDGVLERAFLSVLEKMTNTGAGGGRWGQPGAAGWGGGEALKSGAPVLTSPNPSSRSSQFGGAHSWVRIKSTGPACNTCRAPERAAAYQKNTGTMLVKLVNLDPGVYQVQLEYLYRVRSAPGAIGANISMSINQMGDWKDYQIERGTPGKGSEGRAQLRFFVKIDKKNRSVPIFRISPAISGAAAGDTQVEMDVWFDYIDRVK